MPNVTHILCPVDFSDFSSRALANAAVLAHWYEARLTALYVQSGVPAFDLVAAVPQFEASAASLVDAGGRTIDSELRRFCGNAAGGVRVRTVVRDRDAASIDKEILAQIEALDADFVVIGSHGHSGFQRLLLGSIAEKVVRQAACPVLVVPPHGGVPGRGIGFTRIVCPVDFSDSSLAALDYALSLVEESDGWLNLLHVIETPPEFREPPTPDGIDVPRVRAAAEAAALTRLRALIPDEVREYCTVTTTAVEGAPSHEILVRAAECRADLIVMGVSGHGAIDRWVFGSNTAEVTRGATCPVLTVRRPV